MTEKIHHMTTENPLDDSQIEDVEKSEKGQITDADQSDDDADNEALTRYIDPFIGEVQVDTHSGVENQVILQGQVTRKAMFTDFISIPAMCVTVFTMQMTFYDHVKEKHPDSKFKCDFCESIFTTSNRLFKHKRLHEYLKYHCDICVVTYCNSPTRSQHIKIH